MNRALGLGFAGLLALGPGCADEAPPEAAHEAETAPFEARVVPEGVLVEIKDRALLHEKPNSFVGKQGVLSVSELAVATCFFESATLGSHSANFTSLEDGESGFSFLWGHEYFKFWFYEEHGELIYTVGRKATRLIERELPDCTEEETSGVLG